MCNFGIKYNRCPQYRKYNRCCCVLNRCNCGINNYCDTDILTFLLFRQLIRNVNCCCRVSPYA